MIIHWNVSPEIFHLGPIVLRWYGLLFATGFYLGYRHVRKAFAALGEPIERADTLLYSMGAGCLVGARLGHCLIYEPEIYLAQPWRIPLIWEGGLASHGAAAGIFLAMAWFCRRGGYRWLALADLLAFPVMIGCAMIRVGNLFNSEILGRAVAGGDLGVVFERIDAIPRHPAQVYEAISYFAIAAALTRFPRRPFGDGCRFGLFLTLVFGARFGIEFIKERFSAFEETLPLSWGQWLSLPLIVWGLWLLLRRAAPRTGLRVTPPN